MKQLAQALRIAMGSFVGVFLGSSVYQYIHWKTHPGLYAMQSAPWYTGILRGAVFTVVSLAGLGAALLWTRKKLRQKQDAAHRAG